MIGNEVKAVRKRPGRVGIFPDGGAVLSVWVPKSLVKALGVVAEGKGMNMSQLVRSMLVHQLANPPSKSVEMPGASSASSEEAAR